jgi:chemotaxis signal transduction protein
MVNKQADKESRIILVHGMGKKTSGKKPVLLFSTTQIEEILHNVNIQPVPFAPDYLLGVCLWRKQIIPVVDAFKRYGMQRSKQSDGECYIVVKVVGKIQGAKQLLQGMLKISKQIITTKMPATCSPTAIKSSDIDKTFVKGAFEYQDDLMIVPDLTSIFCSI